VDLHKVYKQVELEFDSTIALEVCLVLTIDLITKITKKDFPIENHFPDKILKKINMLLSDSPPDRVDLVLKIWSVVHEWLMSEEFEGFGGCEKKTIKKLINGNEDGL